jgi:hypothetical protein
VRTSFLAIAVLVSPAEIRVSVSVAHFVASEMLNVIGATMFIEMFASMRIFTVPAVVPIEAVIDVTPESLAPVVPGTGTYKDAAGKPFRSVIAIRCAIIGRIVEIAIGTPRRRANLNGDLGMYLLRRSRKAESSDGNEQ